MRTTERHKVSTGKTELHRLRITRTMQENGLAILDQNYHRERAQRTEKLDVINARIAEIVAQQKAEASLWEEAK